MTTRKIRDGSPRIRRYVGRCGWRSTSVHMKSFLGSTHVDPFSLYHPPILIFFNSLSQRLIDDSPWAEGLTLFEVEMCDLRRDVVLM